MLSSLTSVSPRLLLAQSLNFALILSTAFMLWKSFSIVTNSPSPIVVVLSGSMEPAFQRGDLLFLWNRDLGSWAGTNGVWKNSGSSGKQQVDEEKADGNAVVGLAGAKRVSAERKKGKDTKVGEIIVYNVEGKSIPIVHRVVRRHLGSNKPLHLLTKGDNNNADDAELYARGQFYLDREKEVIGSVVGYIPYVGYVTILLSEHPWLKTALLGMMGLVVVFQRE
ncbi:signal peptidase complex catalytic subunit SEC11 [Peziza echinospora]|nr:signal peptidase complex catalytic subunit SEC11 [Peziza echinospora]